MTTTAMAAPPPPDKTPRNRQGNGNRLLRTLIDPPFAIMASLVLVGMVAGAVAAVRALWSDYSSISAMLTNKGIWIIVAAIVMMGMGMLLRLLVERDAVTRVEKAEEQAFGGVQSRGPTAVNPGADTGITHVLTGSDKQRSEVVLSPSVPDLFRLYSRQIELYQAQARGRASWSFFWALVAMSAGLVIVAIAAWHVLNANEWPIVAGGSIIAGIGGSISAFLSKTFLEIHKTSLTQLSSYFQQPVVNDHVVMAERVAAMLDAGPRRDEVYENIVDALLSRVRVKPGAVGESRKAKRKGGDNDVGEGQEKSKP